MSPAADTACTAFCLVALAFIVGAVLWNLVQVFCSRRTPRRIARPVSQAPLAGRPRLADLRRRAGVDESGHVNGVAK